MNISKKNSLLALMGSIFLVAIVMGSTILLPGLLDAIGAEDPGQGPDSGSSKLGARIAKYMDDRSSDVVYGWCYNNTFVNLDLSDHFGYYVDGVRISLYRYFVDPEFYISLLHDNTQDTTELSPGDFNQVVDNFEIALEDLDNVIEVMTMDYWPPGFLFDIAYDDETSISVSYSEQHHAVAVTNGTWEILESYPEKLVFNHSWEDTVYFALDDNSEATFLSAIEYFQDFITGSFE
ncbi:MAG: hypothetical protein ACXAEU_04165 [Candidatus Hodarchaeales archaeon]